MALDEPMNTYIPEIDKCLLVQEVASLFTPQLEPGSRAHQSLLEGNTNYGFLLPLKESVSHEVSWTLPPPPTVNWTVAGVLLKSTISFQIRVSSRERRPLKGSMNREKGRMRLFGNQLIPVYDVKAHNPVTRFMHDAWKTFG